MDTWIRKGLVLAVTAAAFAAGTPDSQAAGAEALRIESPWARETAAGQRDGGGFMVITNDGSKADQLVGASSPVSAEVQIHTVNIEQGVMRMRELPGGIPVPAASRVELKPGSLHIMFIKLNHPLKAGEQVPVTLKFREAGEKTVTLEVRSVAGIQPAPMAKDPPAAK